MSVHDRNFYVRRARQELALSEAAPHAGAAAVHRELARAYQRKAGGDDGMGWAPTPRTPLVAVAQASETVR